MTETISSKLSSPDLPSAASVVCDPKFFNMGERTLLGLRATVDEKEFVKYYSVKNADIYLWSLYDIKVLFNP